MKLSVISWQGSIGCLPQPVSLCPLPSMMSQRLACVMLHIKRHSTLQNLDDFQSSSQEPLVTIRTLPLGVAIANFEKSAKNFRTTFTWVYWFTCTKHVTERPSRDKHDLLSQKYLDSFQDHQNTPKYYRQFLAHKQYFSFKSKFLKFYHVSHFSNYSCWKTICNYSQ